MDNAEKIIEKFGENSQKLKASLKELKKAIKTADEIDDERMKLEGAIRYWKSKAEEKMTESRQQYDLGFYEESRECIWRSAEHSQLANWLTELQQRREADIISRYEWDSVLEEVKNG